MTERTCSKCGETKPLSEFHKRRDDYHPRCKVCRRAEERERSRGVAGTPRRKASLHAYYARHREAIIDAQRERRKAVPAKQAARSAARYATQTGKLVPEPCLFCDATPTEAHHHDYTLPLVVTWLCHRHHRLVHRTHA